VSSHGSTLNVQSHKGLTYHFYRATARNATHGIAIAILSVYLSDACIVTK